jgi:hypothetical protein
MMSLRPLKPVRRIIPFSIFRKLKLEDLKSIKPKLKDSKATTTNYELQENAIKPTPKPPKRVMGFIEWCKKNP